jgi:VanZ family protein
MKLKFNYFIPAIIWFIIANFLFFMPGQDLPEVSFLDEIYFDKWVHIGLFAGLVFLTAYPYLKTDQVTKKLLLKIIIGFVFYGIAIEFMQKYFASERSFDITDMIADASGCLFGYVAVNWLKRRLPEKNKPL